MVGLLAVSSFCDASQIKKTEVEVFHIADFSDTEQGDDYYLGKVIYNYNKQSFEYKPVNTRENVAKWKILLWLEHVDKPRIMLSDVSKIVKNMLRIYKKNGIFESIDGERVVITMQYEDFSNSLAYALSKKWGVIDYDVGERYFDLEMSKSIGNELRQAKKKFDMSFPHDEIN